MLSTYTVQTSKIQQLIVFTVQYLYTVFVPVFLDFLEILCGFERLFRKCYCFNSNIYF